MPQIPIIVSRQGLSPQTFNSPGPEAFGSGIGQELQRSGQIFERMQQGYDTVAAAKLIGEGDANMQAVIAHANQNISDPEEYATYTKDNLEKVYNDTLEAAPNEAVKRRVQVNLADNRARADVVAKYGAFTKKKDAALGDLDIIENTLSKAVVSAPDEQTRQTLYRLYGEAVGSASAAGFLDSRGRQQRIEKFDINVLNRRANVLILKDPDSFYNAANAGEFDRLGEDKVLELREKARKEQDHEIARQDKIGGEIRKRVEQGWYSDLGNNQLDDARIRNAINNNDPWITPQKALEFQKHKQEGTSGDKTPVTAIMSSYYATGRNMGQIQRTRKELQQLQATGGPNDFINKALNELQSDQTTLENQGIARDANSIAAENRSISHLKNEYEAGKDILPGPLKNLLGNSDTQDKAKIEDTYRRQGPEAAKKLVESLTKQKENKAAALPEQTKKVLQLP